MAKRRRPRRKLSKLDFAIAVVRGFLANGGLTHAAAIAHHMLLSAVPLLMVTLAISSRFVDPHRLARVLTAEASQILPRAQARLVVDNAMKFVEAPELSGWVGFGSLLVFSTLAFRTLQRAIDAIFAYRGAHARRPLWSSTLLSVAYVLAIGAATMAQTLAIGSVARVLGIVGVQVPLAALWFSFSGLVILLGSIYVVMPVGKVALRPAFLAAAWAAVSWAIWQRVLLFYLATYSPVSWIFGSLATAIVVLISFEALAAIVLLGAQAVAEADQRAE